MTAAEELVPRLTQAGCPEALPVLVEVFRGGSRSAPSAPGHSVAPRLAVAAGQDVRDARHRTVPRPVAQRLETLATGTFL